MSRICVGLNRLKLLVKTFRISGLGSCQLGGVNDTLPVDLVFKCTLLSRICSVTGRDSQAIACNLFLAGRGTSAVTAREEHEVRVSCSL